MEKVLAAVRIGPSRTELREFPMPDIPDDAALMKMEVGGICGTDVKLYKHPPSNAPVIMGHENIGTIAKAGSEFTAARDSRKAISSSSSTTSLAANASGAMPDNTGIARTPTGAPIRTPSATATPRRNGRRICGAASPNMSTCRGTRSCITCRRASPRSSQGW